MKLLLTCYLLCCSISVFGQTTVLKYKGGTYSFGGDTEEGSAGSLKVRPISAEKAVFYLDVNKGAPSYNMGMLLGVMHMNGNVGVFEKKDNDYMDCKLQFVFKGDQVEISTLDSRYDCGFGHGVIADNVYKLSNKSIPTQYVNGEGDLMPLIEAYASMIDPDYYYTPKGGSELERPIKSGLTVADNQTWYKNDSLNEVMLNANYGDYVYTVWVHFFKDKIPADLIDHMELTLEDGSMASMDQKKKDVEGLIAKAIDSDTVFFESVRGARLGDAQTKAIEMYGVPDQITDVGGYERLIWWFIGDQEFDSETDDPDTKLAWDSFGFKVIQYYQNDKLVGQMLMHAMP